MIFALVGNQNCGKTTLFNALTGSNQHVGNFPGVTVDQKMGEIIDEKSCSVGYVLAFPLRLGSWGLFVAFSCGLFTAAILFYAGYRAALRKSMARGA